MYYRTIEDGYGYTWDETGKIDSVYIYGKFSTKIRDNRVEVKIPIDRFIEISDTINGKLMENEIKRKTK